MSVANTIKSFLRCRWRSCVFLLSFLVLISFCIFLLFPDIKWKQGKPPAQRHPHHIVQIKKPRPIIKKMLQDMSGTLAATGVNPSIMLELPYILPDLQDHPSSCRLAYLMSKGRDNVSIVMGIPTVRRKNYLMDTLQNLTDGLSASEAEDTLVVVMVADSDLKFVLETAREVEMRFASRVHSGLIEVVAPSRGYYYPLQRLRSTLGDPRDYVRWRSKQNLDFAFLMSYCQQKGRFYLQLEDDVVAKPNYVKKMKRFAEKEPWFLLDFCPHGFIGKMFRTEDLSWMIQFLHMFYNEKPAEWLLNYLMFTKFCTFGKIRKCSEDRKMWIRRPSLFRHIGSYSSFRGKVQKLEDNEF